MAPLPPPGSASAGDRPIFATGGPLIARETTLVTFVLWHNQPLDHAKPWCNTHALFLNATGLIFVKQYDMIPCYMQHQDCRLRTKALSRRAKGEQIFDPKKRNSNLPYKPAGNQVTKTARVQRPADQEKVEGVGILDKGAEQYQPCNSGQQFVRLQSILLSKSHDYGVMIDCRMNNNVTSLSLPRLALPSAL